MSEGKKWYDSDCKLYDRHRACFLYGVYGPRRLWGEDSSMNTARRNVDGLSGILLGFVIVPRLLEGYRMEERQQKTHRECPIR
jgi:hypothetical protein